MKHLLSRNIFSKWNCHHLHIDKSYTLTRDNFCNSQAHMKSKWNIMRDIKKEYTYGDLYKRMLNVTQHLVNNGCINMRTFIDVDDTVGLEPLYVAVDVKNYWKNHNINLQIGTQLLNGLESSENIKLFMEASNLVDFIGCLPSRDTFPEKHLDIVFDRARELDKDVEAHLDQCNIPTEYETELFCDYVEKYNFKGKARAIHCISLACHPIEYQNHIATRLRKLNIGVIVCPSAALSMVQHNEFKTPIHNSIAPIGVFIDNDISIGIGIDNISDIFMPFSDGNIEFELRLLVESSRLYDIDALQNIISNDMGFN